MWIRKITINSVIFLVALGLAFPAGFLFFEKEIIASQNYLPKVDIVKGTGPEVYLLEGGVKHWIPSIEIFNQFRYSWQNLKVISDSVLYRYPRGDDVSSRDDYSDGSLLQGSGSKVYLIELGKRRWIPSPEIFTGNNFGWKYIIRVDDDVLDDYNDGDNLTLSESNRYPETIILSGPEDGEATENSEITFEYSGTNPLGPTTDLSFEVFLSGYDDDWKSTSRTSKTYTLSGQSGSYIFYVRAENEEGYFDPSPASISFSTNISSSHGKVEIKKVYPKKDDFKEDYIILENTDDDEKTINISGWKIKTKKGDITIPQAIKKLKAPFSTSDYSDINLIYEGEVIISFGPSPKGVNFQINQCAGYLSQNSTFYPSLSEKCSEPEESEYSHLKSTCREYIKDLDRCEMPDYSGNLEISLDSQCTGYLNSTFTYQHCYDEHYQEVGFFKDEWRIFLNKSIDGLDNSIDTITLEDKSGQVVDQYQYSY